ncbi:hypothetical protein [Streptomyces sp. NPDC001089]
MADSRVAMEYTGEDGAKKKLRESTVNRMRFVASRGSVGRLQTPEGQSWKAHEVRALQDSGVWNVDWIEPGDINREHAWVIQGLTARGRELLDTWERVVERGEGASGPARTRRPGS